MNDIVETHLKNQDVKLTVKDCIYPQTKDTQMPMNFFCAAFAGARGSGKTYLSCKLVKMMHDKKCYIGDRVIPQRVLLISPSAHSPSNDIFKSLNIDWDNDVFEEFTEKLLDDIIKKLHEDQEQAKEYQNYIKAYIKFEKITNIDDLPVEQLMLLHSYDFQHPDMIPKPAYPNSFYTVIILDDLVSTSAFKQGRSRLTYHMLKNRHQCGGISYILNVQSIMAIPKSIRMNLNLISIFRFANKLLILNDLSPLISATTSIEEFDLLYSYATKDNQHDCLLIDLTKSQPIFKRNLDTLLEFKDNVTIL